MTTGPADNPLAAICARIESDNRRGDGGWLHIIRDDGYRPEQARRRIVRFDDPQAVVVDFSDMAKRCESAANPAALASLADTLGLAIGSLRRLTIGWSTRQGAWTFPMRNAEMDVIGIRTRLPSGQKLAIAGSKSGLFIPENLTVDDFLLIAEGPTDAAALLGMGFAAIGRPSCNGGLGLIAAFVIRRQPAHVVIVADRDEPGQRGAANLASTLAVYVASVRVIMPPEGIKDARAWKQSGATHEDVIDAIDAAPAKMLAINARRMEAR